MDFLPPSITTLIEELAKWPGIGPKTAQRLTFQLLKKNPQDVKKLGEAVCNVREGVLNCSKCFTLCAQDPCMICSDESRDRSKLCVVERTWDMIALERTREYKGLYHVLEGRLSPLDGVGPDDLRIKELWDRLNDISHPVREVILALNPDLEGDTTALYLNKKINSIGEFSVSRIARGIPSGGNLEYTDDMTLASALEGRTKF